MDARHPDIWIGDTNTGQEFTQTWPAVVFVNALPRCGIDRDDPPKHFFRRTVINSPHSQEFMVSRISSVVTTFLSPLLDEFTLMEVF